MDKFFAAKQYFFYRLNSVDAHGIHSPFVYDLLNDVILDNTPYYGFDVIESVRAKHLLDFSKIDVLDFGTGNSRTVSKSKVAKSSVKPKKYSQLLFRLAKRFAGNTILELGTSLGITTLYLSLSGNEKQIYTLEGSEQIAELAQRNFNRLKRENIKLITGNFNDTLPEVLSSVKQVDFVFFDGNHRKEPTIGYFKQCLEKASENSVFIFDDICWSKEMNEAWKEIIKHEAVSISIDLYQLGLVFFRKGIIKQHFMVKF